MEDRIYMGDGAYIMPDEPRKDLNDYSKEELKEIIKKEMKELIIPLPPPNVRMSPYDAADIALRVFVGGDKILKKEEQILLDELYDDIINEWRNTLL